MTPSDSHSRVQRMSASSMGPVRNEPTTHLDDAIVLNAASTFPTPFYLYNLNMIRASAQDLEHAFRWAPRYRNYFSVKALPRARILSALHSVGSGAECCSLPELLLAKDAGYRGPETIYTCMYPLPDEVAAARDIGAIVALDYAANAPALLKAYTPDLLLFRLNPGDRISGTPLLGVPRTAKFGSTEQQITAAFRHAHEAGVQRLGIHGMFASNTLDASYLESAASVLFDSALAIMQHTKLPVAAIDLGGGLGLPYRGEPPLDVHALGQRLRTLYEDRFASVATESRPSIVMECGRIVTGPHAVLVTRVLQVKETCKRFIFVDASATNYPRHGVYGGYNRITVLGKDDRSPKQICDVVGLLCDNCDRFAVDRELPLIEQNDLLLIHDAGAHASAMSYDYNGRLRCSEVCIDGNALVLLKSAQTADQYLASS